MWTASGSSPSRTTCTSTWPSPGAPTTPPPPSRGCSGRSRTTASSPRTSVRRPHPPPSRASRRSPVKIVKVEAIPFAIPYRKPLRFASGEVHVADHVLVRVHTDDGVVGTAEAPPRPYTYGETQESIVAVIDKLFAPQLVGLTLLEREAVHARLDRTVGNPAAKAAVDMAIWDALGQTAGPAGLAAARRLHRPDAGLPHGRLRADARDGRRGRAGPRPVRHPHVQGEGRPAPDRARRRRLPGAADGPRPGRRALRRRQPRLDARRGRAGAATRWPTST